MSSVSKPDTKQFLITGGAGFVGSHLADALLSIGHKVVVIDNLSTGRLENISHLLDHPLFRMVRADVNDAIVLDRYASESQVIIHLAAAVGVKLIVERPVHTIETNIMGTEAVLVAAQRYGCRTLIASTSEVFGKGARVPFHEDDDVVLGNTTRHRWAYAASKMIDEFLGLAYFTERGLPVVVARLFNTVGPRQTGHYGMVIPTFMRQALLGKPITIHGSGEQRRCFCDVRDVVRALISLSEHPNALGRVFNVGGTREITINELADLIIAATRSKSDVRKIPYEEAYGPGFEDMMRRVPDTSRIESLTGWAPTITLESTIEAVRDHMTETELRR